MIKNAWKYDQTYYFQHWKEKFDPDFPYSVDQIISINLLEHNDLYLIFLRTNKTKLTKLFS